MTMLGDLLQKLQTGTRSLKTQLALYFIPIAVLPAIGISYYATHTFEENTQETLTRRARSERDAIVVEIEAQEKDTLEQARRHSRNRALLNALEVRNLTDIEEITASYRPGLKVRIYGPSGNFIYRRTRNVKDDELPYISNEGLKKVRAFNETLDRYFTSDGGEIVTVIRILLADKNRVYGILEEESVFGKAEFAALKTKRGCEILFLNREFSAMTGTFAVSKEEVRGISKQIFRGPEDGIWSGSIEPSYIKLGEGRYAAFLYDMPAYFGKQKHWGYLGVFLSMTSVDATTARLKMNLIYITGLLVLGFALLIFIFSNRIVKPIELLVLAMKRIKTGRVEEIPPIESAYEIEYLVHAFNDMSRNIILAKKALEMKVQELKSANLEIKTTQTQLVQSAKMISLGQIVAGVAHELNNPIAFIYSNMQSLNEYVSKFKHLVEEYHRVWSQLSPDQRREIEAIEKELDIEYILKDMESLTKSCVDGANRTKDIVLGLRTFSRMDAAVFRQNDIHEGIRNTLRLISAEFKNRIEVHEEYGSIPLVECSSSLLNQVFMNLLSNAAQAIEGKGDVWIRTRLENESVRIEFEDNGAGISPENLSKIFDPFFTTKRVGQGTGLGLSIAYGLVEKHHGTINVESRVGKGTRFTLILPVSQPLIKAG